MPSRAVALNRALRDFVARNDDGQSGAGNYLEGARGSLRRCGNHALAAR